MSRSRITLPASLNQFLATTRGKIIFCSAGVVLALLIFYLQMADEIGPLLPGEEAITALDRELKKIKAAEADLGIKAAEREKLREAVDAKFAAAWQSARHGEAELELRAKVEQAAKSVDLKLTSLSTVRTTKFNNDLTFLELDMNAVTDLDQLAKFFTALEAVEPQLYWRRLDLRPDFSGTGGVSFSATVRCLGNERAEEPAQNTQKKETRP